MSTRGGCGHDRAASRTYQCPDGVDPQDLRGVGPRPTHVGQRRQVVDDVGGGLDHGVAHRLPVGDLHLVIDGDHLVPALDEMGGQPRADEASRSGHQGPHAPNLTGDRPDEPGDEAPERRAAHR